MFKGRIMDETFNAACKAESESQAEEAGGPLWGDPADDASADRGEATGNREEMSAGTCPSKT